MSLCTLVDANSIAVYQYEKITGVAGVGSHAIDHIFSVGHIAFDEGNFIREEWHKTASGAAAGVNILDWVADRMQENKIRIVPYKKDTPLNKTLTGFGMKLGDKVYVFVAIAGRAKMVVTDDIDFHDPTKKNALNPEKTHIKKTKCGPVCKYLYESHKIMIGDLGEVPTLLK